MTSGFLAIAWRPSVARRALGYAAVVGPILIVIYQGDALWRGELSGVQLIQMGLTLLVPYCVSTLSSVGALRGGGAH